MTNYLNAIPYYLNRFFMKRYTDNNRIPQAIIKLYNHLYNLELENTTCFSFSLDKETELNRLVYGRSSIILIKKNISKDVSKAINGYVDKIDFNCGIAYIVFVPEDIHDENGISIDEMSAIIINLLVECIYDSKMDYDINSTNSKYLKIYPSFVASLMIKNRFGNILAKDAKDIITRSYKFLRYNDNIEGGIYYTTEEIDDLFDSHLGYIDDKELCHIHCSPIFVTCTHMFNTINE